MSAPRKLLASLCAATACLLAFGAPGAAAFGIVKWDGFIAADEAGTTAATQAGSHPYEFETEIRFPLKKGTLLNEGDVKDAIVELPAGLTFNPEAVPTCTTAELLTRVRQGYGCGDDAAIGVATVRLAGGLEVADFPIYNMEPSPGQPARLAFKVIFPVVFIEPRIRSEGDYGTTVELTETSQALAVSGSEIRLWGVPHDPGHDEDRGNCATFAAKYGGSCPLGVSPKDIVGEPGQLPPTPLITMQSRCSGPLEFPVRVDSWQEPGVFHEASFTTHDAEGNPVGVSGCERLPFAPELETRMSTDQAETGSGLELSLGFDDQGLLNPTGLAQSTTEKAVVTLPEGVTINPSVGEGLGVCTPAQEARETVDSRPGEGCPNASKLGTLRVRTPLVDEAIEGSVFLAQQDDPATTAARRREPLRLADRPLHGAAQHQARGAGQAAGEGRARPATGQLVATVEDIPQIPVLELRLPLQRGRQGAAGHPADLRHLHHHARFSPPGRTPATPLTITSSFQITKGVGGGPLPAGRHPALPPALRSGLDQQQRRLLLAPSTCA